MNCVTHGEGREPGTDRKTRRLLLPVVLFMLLGLGYAGVLGELSIAGYTTNDEQVFGPSLERIAGDTLHGIHVVWKDGRSGAMYNFLGRAAQTWRWPEGVPVFPRHASLGNLCLSPRTGTLNVVGTYLEQGRHHTIAANDTVPGSGNFSTISFFSYYDRDMNVLGMTANGSRHYLALRRDSATYHRGASPTHLGRIGPFPTHTIAGSPTTYYVASLWTRTQEPNAGTLYLRVATNLGYSWRDTVAISRTIPSSFRNAFYGAYALYDRENVLHATANTYDGVNRHASEIWHYCSADTPAWTRIHRCDGAAGMGNLPSEALVAGRPSLGINDVTGEFFAVWEQFAPADPDPETGILRGEIWAARSQDRGRTWGSAVRLTRPDGTSKRYPSLARTVDGFLHVQFLIDSIAGAALRNEGRMTRNPIAYLKVPAALLPGGLAEAPAAGSARGTGLVVAPNPALTRVDITIRHPPTAATFGVIDAAGRLVRRWDVPCTAAGDRLSWNLTDGTGRRVRPGIYFCMLAGPQVRETAVLVVP